MKAILYQDSGGISVNGGCQYWDSINADIQHDTNTILIKGNVLKKVSLNISTQLGKTMLNLLKCKFQLEKAVEIVRTPIKEEKSIKVAPPSHWFYEKTDGQHLKPLFLVTTDGRVFIGDFGDREFKVWLQNPYWWIAGWPGDESDADELYREFMQSIGLRKKVKQKYVASEHYFA